MHVEYGEIDSDYVFVNLFSGKVGKAMTYANGPPAVPSHHHSNGDPLHRRRVRHSHATDMVRQGVPIEVVARLLTHRSSTTTSQTYVHLKAADIRDALQERAWQKEEAP